MGSIIQSKLGLFQEPRELLGRDVVVFAQDAFGLIPEIFKPVDYDCARRRTLLND
jgi:hypothetical protein